MRMLYGVSLAALTVSLVLEILPYGAVLNFGNPDGSVIRRTYSYFSMMPFGYANFGPLPAALLTVVILIGTAALFAVRAPQPKLNTVMLTCAIIAFLFSVLPVIMFGWSSISSIGIIISCLLLAGVVLLSLARISLRHE